MKKGMKFHLVTSVVRHVLTAGGAVAVSHGLLDEGTVNTIAGSLATVAGLVWAAIDKRTHKK